VSREKILKLLELTNSNHDAEALNAIRKANEILGKEGWHWEDVFAKSPDRKKNLPPGVQRRPPPPKFLTVETMFDEILRRSLSDTVRAKIEQLKYIYEWTESLSGEEVNTLINTYNRNC
jgi:hypothetical protein